MNLFMVNWSGAPIPDPEMMVLRRVAVLVQTGVYEATEVGFVHDICEGILKAKGVSVYGAVGGFFFFGDLGQRNGAPNDVDFFLPRRTLHLKAEDTMLTRVTHRLQGDRYAPEGYPDDVDSELMAARGNLRITIRKE